MHFRLSIGSDATSFPQNSGLVYQTHSLEMMQVLMMQYIINGLR